MIFCALSFPHSKSVENFSVGRLHYQHFNKFGRYGNSRIQLYIYNDVVIPTENTIPAIYQRINYFNKLLVSINKASSIV